MKFKDNLDLDRRERKNERKKERKKERQINIDRKKENNVSKIILEQSELA